MGFHIPPLREKCQVNDMNIQSLSTFSKHEALVSYVKEYKHMRFTPKHLTVALCNFLFSLSAPAPHYSLSELSAHASERAGHHHETVKPGNEGGKTITPLRGKCSSLLLFCTTDR